MGNSKPEERFGEDNCDHEDISLKTEYSSGENIFGKQVGSLFETLECIKCGSITKRKINKDE